MSPAMSLVPGLQGLTVPNDPPEVPAQGKAKASRFVLVDALRGVAASWVVFVHASVGHHIDALEAALPAWVHLVISNGRIPVAIFFVLSGFVIAYSVSRYEVNARFVGRFAIRRSIRLDPPYWASIVLTLAFGYASQFFVRGKVYELPDARSILFHLAYLQDITDSPEINPVYWTLSLEVQFYLVFCLLLALAHKLRRDRSDKRSLYAIFVPAMLVSAAWPLGLVPGGNAWPWPGLFLPLWYGFLLGMAACWAMLGLIPAGLFYAYALLLGVGAARHPDAGLIACLATAVLLYVAARLGKLTAWLNFRWLLFLGMISYSLYLIHNPITGAFYRVAYRIAGRGVAGEALWLVPMLAVNVAAAYAFWWLFERTSMAFCHRIRMNEPARPEPPEIEPPSTRA